MDGRIDIDPDPSTHDHPHLPSPHSAGYYNSVGSKEGWQPRTWQSSRASRAGVQQRPEDFMDEEDGLLGRELEAQLPYDTLGERARRLVRDQVGRQAAGAAIPGIEAVDELLGT